jgi:hypothetical protein
VSDSNERVSKTAHMERWRRELGLEVEVSQAGDGWTRYTFTVEVEGMMGRRQLFAARGWREAEAFVAGWTLCKGGE